MSPTQLRNTPVGVSCGELYEIGEHGYPIVHGRRKLKGMPAKTVEPAGSGYCEVDASQGIVLPSGLELGVCHHHLKALTPAAGGADSEPDQPASSEDSPEPGELVVDTCPACDGSGHVMKPVHSGMDATYRATCDECGGDGEVVTPHEPDQIDNLESELEDRLDRSREEPELMTDGGAPVETPEDELTVQYSPELDHYRVRSPSGLEAVGDSYEDGNDYLKLVLRSSVVARIPQNRIAPGAWRRFKDAERNPGQRIGLQDTGQLVTDGGTRRDGPPGSKVQRLPEDCLADYAMELTTEELTALRLAVDPDQTPKESAQVLAESVLGL